jgi:alginate O-acetyltransferase complex protein AlgI
VSFVQFEFPILVVTALTVYWAVGHRAQNLLLLATSLLFYGWVHPAWLGLLVGSATLGYTTALGMAQRPQHRLALLRVSLVGNALILGTFKYFDFFVGSVDVALDALGLHIELPLLGVMLPAGISFYTFQSISYTIDVYRGDTHARTHYLDYLLYLAFFPQLVAGPIERATHLLPQLESPRTFQLDNLRSGLGLALWGAFKKVVIADTVARYVNGIYGTPVALPSPAAHVADDPHPPRRAPALPRAHPAPAGRLLLRLPVRQHHRPAHRRRDVCQCGGRGRQGTGEFLYFAF